MKILLANPRGFCAGVNMAVECLQRALDLYGMPMYVYHEIVHNKCVVEKFEEQGVVFVQHIDEVPKGSCLLYSAHGVSPEVCRQADRRLLHTIDATCPLVKKVHNEAVRFARLGYTIVLIGHAGHDEVLGTLGMASEHMRLVESVEDVDRLEVPDPNRIAYLTQTTLSVDDATRIIQRLGQRFASIVGPPKADICYATQNRQEAVRTLVQEADMVLVLGSQNSSNSKRLAEIARTYSRPSQLIDSAVEIDLNWFQGDETVLITAGASAPSEVIDQTIAFLCEHFHAQAEERSVCEEHAHFPLPRELRESDGSQLQVLHATDWIDESATLSSQE
jgi:4-hydroxy-3-methylbut-2-en-1-yl diphosphate reductase